MVDPDFYQFQVTHLGSNVQIPLWSILTRKMAVTLPLFPSSNSSMVDPDKCFSGGQMNYSEVQIPLWSILTTQNNC